MNQTKVKELSNIKMRNKTNDPKKEMSQNTPQK